MGITDQFTVLREDTDSSLWIASCVPAHEVPSREGHVALDPRISYDSRGPAPVLSRQHTVLSDTSRGARGRLQVPFRFRHTTKRPALFVSGL